MICLQLQLQVGEEETKADVGDEVIGPVLEFPPQPSSSTLSAIHAKQFPVCHFICKWPIEMLGKYTTSYFSRISEIGRGFISTFHSSLVLLPTVCFPSGTQLNSTHPLSASTSAHRDRGMLWKCFWQRRMTSKNTFRYYNSCQ